MSYCVPNFLEDLNHHQRYRPRNNPGHRIEQRRHQPRHGADVLAHRLNPVMHYRHAVGENPATDHEHRRRADHRQAFHHVRRGAQNRPADAARGLAGLLGQPQTEVIELDDTGDQAVNADGHDNGDARQHDYLLHQRRIGDRAEGDGDDFRRQNLLTTTNLHNTVSHAA